MFDGSSRQELVGIGEEGNFSYLSVVPQRGYKTLEQIVNGLQLSVLSSGFRGCLLERSLRRRKQSLVEPFDPEVNWLLLLVPVHNAKRDNHQRLGIGEE